MKRNKQKKATVTVDEYNDIVKAEQALKEAVRWAEGQRKQEFACG